MFSPLTKLKTTKKQKPFKVYRQPFNLQLRLMSIFCSLLVLSWQATPAHTKDLMHQRGPQQQLYRQPKDLLRHYGLKSGVNNATTHYQDFETSVVSWTGAKLTNSPVTLLSAQSAQTEMFHTRLEHLKQDEQEFQRHENQAQNQPHRHRLGNKRRKTKSGLLIESNIEMDYSEVPQISMAASTEYDTEAEMLKAMSTLPTASSHSHNRNRNQHKPERKRNRQQMQRKRNGRNGGAAGGGGGGGGIALGLAGGQRQKLQRNGKFPFSVKP